MKAKFKNISIKAIFSTIPNKIINLKEQINIFYDGDLKKYDGLFLSYTMIQNGARNVLLCVGDTISKIVNPLDSNTAPIFGDAGSTTLISCDNTNKDSYFSLHADGKGYENLIYPNSAFRIDNKEKYLFMNGAEIFNFSIDKEPKSNNKASFIWISSNASIKAQKGLANYSASKAGINAAIKSIALEVAPKYRINAISPGFVLTEMIESWKSVYDKEYISNIDMMYPLGIGKVEYITPLVIFLLSKDSAYITGQNIVIDGGGIL